MFSFPRRMWRLLSCLLILLRIDAFPGLFHGWKGRIIRTVLRLGPPSKQLVSAPRLADALTRLGPAFIKLGQAMSLRPDLVGHEIAQALRCLQDKVPPFSSELAIGTVEEELGDKVENLYASFDPHPKAAASIAQVHFATALDGQPLAVKILRPAIEARFAEDIAVIDLAARILVRCSRTARRMKLVEVVDTFKSWVTIELDLRLEAAAASELATNFKDKPEGFDVPSIYWPLCTKRVLTLERVNGFRLDDQDAMRAAGLDPGDILARSARIFFIQVFRDGFFHADLHPGNVFVTEDGRIRPVDFGIMGRLSKRSRLFLAEMLQGFLERDYERVATVHFRYGLIDQGQSKARFILALRAIGEPIMGLPIGDVSLGRLLAQLFETTAQFNMSPHMDFLLLQKTMLGAEGIGRMLQPGQNMWVMAEPLIKLWVQENCSAQAQIQDLLHQLTRSLQHLPAWIDWVEARMQETKS
ncbi:MAG: AarF/UbiB family protein [Pseudomonadota bacterium]